jgi:hypothetical protein
MDYAGRHIGFRGIVDVLRYQGSASRKGASDSNYGITGLIGIYTDPHILIAYTDGEVRQEFTFVYAAEIESGELKIDNESKEAAWVPLSSAAELPLAESQRRRLKDAMRYQKERRTFLR